MKSCQDKNQNHPYHHHNHHPFFFIHEFKRNNDDVYNHGIKTEKKNEHETEKHLDQFALQS